MSNTKSFKILEYTILLSAFYFLFSGIMVFAATPSLYFEAYTYGFLPPNIKWSLHKHENITEICLAIKGRGTIKDKDNNIEKFGPGDRFIFPPDTEHEIENTSQEVAEFYFFRLKAK